MSTDPTGAQPAQAMETPAEEKRRTRWGPIFWISVVIVALFIIIAITADWIAPYDPFAQDLIASSQGPSAAHWLGTDQLGRDILSRLMVGSRTGIIGPWSSPSAPR